MTTTPIAPSKSRTPLFDSDIAAALSVPLRLEIDEARVRPEASEVMRLVSDARRAREILGWSPTVALTQGLGRTIDWLRTDPSVARAHEYVR